MAEVCRGTWVRGAQVLGRGRRLFFARRWTRMLRSQRMYVLYDLATKKRGGRSTNEWWPQRLLRGCEAAKLHSLDLSHFGRRCLALA